MMVYKIKYVYDSGDSFGSSIGLEDHLELDWTDYNIALQNLHRIEEHYKMNSMISDLHLLIDEPRIDEQELFSLMVGEDWFVNVKKLCVSPVNDPKKWRVIDESEIKKLKKDKNNIIGEVFDDYYAKHCLILYSDEGKPFQFHAPWIGHHERLESVEIAIHDDRNKIVFRK